MGGHLPLLPHAQGVSWSGGSSDQCLLLHGGDDMDVQGSRLRNIEISEKKKHVEDLGHDVRHGYKYIYIYINIYIEK